MKYFVMADGSVVFQSEVEVEAAHSGVSEAEELCAIKREVDEAVKEFEEE